ncbi:MAG: hypothetical protein AAGB00_04200 [Planctomycetota bacterium]
MNYRLSGILWAMALVATAVAAFGPIGLLGVAGVFYAWALLTAGRPGSRRALHRFESALLIVVIVCTSLAIAALLAGVVSSQPNNSATRRLLPAAAFTLLTIAPAGLKLRRKP